MKTNLISLIALNILALSPAYGAPKERNCPYLGGHHQSCPYLTGHGHGHGHAHGSHDMSSSDLVSLSQNAETLDPAPAVPEKISREQAGARKLVANLTAIQKSGLLGLLNEGTARELTVFKGVSRTRAAAIANARPFQSIDEVILVKGIGVATMDQIVSHARSLTTTKKS